MLIDWLRRVTVQARVAEPGLSCSCEGGGEGGAKTIGSDRDDPNVSRHGLRMGIGSEDSPDRSAPIRKMKKAR